jgi:proline iminopeptidase
MPAEPSGRLVPVHDTHLFIVERGPEDALPVLVLHGGPGLDHTVFGDYLDPLTDRYRLVLVDLRAHGRSDQDCDPHTWTLQQHASDVSAVAAAIGVERYAVLGHSFGAFVALQHAADAPGAAVATVASDGVPHVRYLDAIAQNLATFEPVELRHQVASSWERESQVTTEAEVHQLLADQMPFHFADPRDPRIPSYLAQTAHLRASLEVMRSSPIDLDLEERLPHVTQPLLACVGRHDRTCPPEASARIAELAPHGELYVFEHAGHMPFVESQEEYLQVVGDFLDRATA